jgi:hypothetical protein
LQFKPKISSYRFVFIELNFRHYQVHREVVRRIELLTRLARGRPPPVRTLRRFLIRFMTGVPATAAAMKRTLTGLDHELELA